MEDLVASAYQRASQKQSKPLTHRDDPMDTSDYKNRKAVLFALN